jgi:hypothetical protein
VNFKKNEKPYTGDNSEVLKMVQMMDSEPAGPDPGVSGTHQYDDPALAPAHDKGLFGSRSSQSRTFKYLSDALHDTASGEFFSLLTRSLLMHLINIIQIRSIIHLSLLHSYSFHHWFY